MRVPRLAALVLAAAWTVAAQPIAGDLSFSRRFPGLGIQATALAPDGSILVGGIATQPGLPVTANALQRDFNPSTCGVTPGPGLVPNPCGDGYAAWLTAAGDLRYASYFGGAGRDTLYGVAAGPDGDAYLLGLSNSAEFRTGRGPFVMQLHPDGTIGFARALAPDPDVAAHAIAVSGGVIYVAGHASGDVFLTRLDARSGDVLSTKTIGGSGLDYAAALAVDGAGNAYVTGQTASADFPVTAGAWHAVAPPTPLQQSIFVTEISAAGDRVIASAVFGGEANDAVSRIALAPNGDVALAGTTGSRQFPTTARAIQTENMAGNAAWLARLPADLSAPVFSTLLEIYTYPGAIVPEPDGSIDVFGNTQFHFFPTTADALERCPQPSFMARIAPAGDALRYASFLTLPGDENILRFAAFTPAGFVLGGSNTIASYTTPRNPPASRLCAVGSASFDRYLTWAGELVTIFGSNLAPRKVDVNGVAATLLYVSPGQVNIAIPRLDRTGTLHIDVDGAGTIDAPTADRVPGLFRVWGTHAAAALNEDGSANGPDHPARPGSRLTFFGSGFGPDPAVKLYIRSVEAPLRSVREAGGLLQIDVTVPDLPPGRYPVDIMDEYLFGLGLVEVWVDGAAAPRL